MTLKYPGLKKKCHDGSFRHETCEEIKGIIVCHDCKQTLGRKTEIWSRVVGYLRPTNSWNTGKKEEFDMRKTFKINPNGVKHGENK